MLMFRCITCAASSPTKMNTYLLRRREDRYLEAFAHRLEKGVVMRPQPSINRILISLLRVCL